MKVTVKGFLHWHKYNWEPEAEYVFYHFDMSKNDPSYVVVAPHEFEVDIPEDFDAVPKQIEAMRQKQQDIRADAQLKVNNIEEQIQKLLCLEYKEPA